MICQGAASVSFDKTVHDIEAAGSGSFIAALVAVLQASALLWCRLQSSLHSTPPLSRPPRALLSARTLQVARRQANICQKGQVCVLACAAGCPALAIQSM